MVTGSRAPLSETVAAWRAIVFGRRRLLRLTLLGGVILFCAVLNSPARMSEAQVPNSPTARAAQAQISPAARVAADALFGDRCAVCHGPEGDGKGPGAANLNPRPIDFHNSKWQRSVSDESIAKAIIYGGPAVGLSASMSANPDLEDRPDVVAALVERIRKIGDGSLARSGPGKGAQQ